MEKIVIFGVGTYCKKRLGEFKNVNVVAFVDNRNFECNEFINDIPVYSPSKLKNIEYDKICIMTGRNYAEEIKEQLIGLGISEHKIFESDRLYFKARMEKEIQSFGHDAFVNDYAILVPNLFSSGGVRAALYATMALKKTGRTVTIISPSEGEMKKEFLDTGAAVIIASDISESNERLWDFIKNRKVVIANGLYFSYLVNELDKLTKTKVIWWLHSGRSFYKTYYSKDDFREIKRIKVLGVSSIVCDDFRKNTSIEQIGLLPFGIPYEFNKKIKKDDRLTFALIGAVMPVKGIDIYIQAIKQIPDDHRSICRFYVIGAFTENNYANQMKQMSEDIDEIIFTGHLNHNKVIELMSEIDIVVSASREDMLPITSIEALMNEKMCIIPDNIGTKDYVEADITAKIYQSENTNQLCEAMTWCINNTIQVEKIRKAGKKVYDNWFSMDAFGNNLLKAMEE